MTTNSQNTRPTSRPGDTTTVDTTTNPVMTPTGVGGVAVFDQDADGTASSSMRPSTSVHSDTTPATTGSGSSPMGWIIGLIVLIVLAYFLMQILF